MSTRADSESGELGPGPVYDGHCHVASTDLIPDEFVAGVVENVRRRLEAGGTRVDAARLRASFDAQHQDHLADELVLEMDRAGIARSVLLVPDFGLRMATKLTPAEMAARHVEIRQRHPGRFWVFIGADPRRGESGVRSFERSIDEFGFEGLKLYPPCGYSPSDPSLFPYYEICQHRNLPVFVHTGPTVAALDYAPAHPLEIDGAARNFPNVNFILGHGGVVHVDVAGYLAGYRRNVYLDIGGFAGTPFSDGWAAHLNRLFRSNLNHKILFGTDWPLNRMSGGLAPLMREMEGGGVALDGIKRRERTMIFGGNLGRLLTEVGEAGPT